MILLVVKKGVKIMEYDDVLYYVVDMKTNNLLFNGHGNLFYSDVLEAMLIMQKAHPEMDLEIIEGFYVLFDN